MRLAHGMGPQVEAPYSMVNGRDPQDRGKMVMGQQEEVIGACRKVDKEEALGVRTTTVPTGEGHHQISKRAVTFRPITLSTLPIILPKDGGREDTLGIRVAEVEAATLEEEEPGSRRLMNGGWDGFLGLKGSTTRRSTMVPGGRKRRGVGGTGA